MDRQDEIHDMPAGDGGERYTTPPRLPRDEIPGAPRRHEEDSPSRAFGEIEGDEGTSNIILPERGEFTRDDLESIRWIIDHLNWRRRRAIAESRTEQLGSEEWFQCIDEVTALCDTIQTLRREFRNN